MKKLFRFVEQLNKTCPFRTQFYLAARRTLIDEMGLPLLLHLLGRDNQLEGIRPHVARAILEHILLRTIAFNKLFEHLRMSDLINGIPQLGIPPAGFKKSLLNPALQILTNYGLLIKVTPPYKNVQTKVYALNLYSILNDLERHFEIAIEKQQSITELEGDEAGKATGMIALQMQHNLRTLNIYLYNFKPLFEVLRMNVDYTFDAVLNQVTKYFSSVPKEVHTAFQDDIKYKVSRKDLVPKRYAAYLQEDEN